MSQKNPNILIAGHDTFHNKGCQALVFTTTQMMRQAFPNASFTIFSWEPEYDEPRFRASYPDIECHFIKHRFQTGEFSARNRLWLYLHNSLKLRTDRILRANQGFYRAIKNCDLAVISGGDILADYGDETIKHYFFQIAVALALQKPVFVFAQSISRYKSNEMLRFARHYLNQVSMISVREKVSYEYLKEIGITAPFHLAADPAFTLLPCSKPRLKEIAECEHLPLENKFLVGFSVSQTGTRYSEMEHHSFLKIIAAACDQLIDQYRATIIFVPHVIDPKDPNNDDRKVAQAVKGLMKNQQNVFLIEGDYSCAELKAVIGEFSLFIGARTHATIASTSMFVPTIALAYSVKAHGIMEDVFDKTKCLCDISTLTFDELWTKSEYLIKNRETVLGEMKERSISIKERSNLNIALAKKLLMAV
jgi:colanic acid/amylovoran biosynthesis protein